jgi:ribosomal protein S18 acetylase RimI-like enzyme
MSESQLRDRFSSPLSKPEDEWRVLIGPDGRMVGSAATWHPEPTAERVFVFAVAEDRDPAIYEQLLDWGEERARSLTEGRAGRAHTSAEAENDVLAAILRRRGYDLVRHFFTMEIDLDEEPEQPVWPDGIAVRTLEPGEERAVYDVDMEAFHDHWDFFPVPFEEWRDYFLGSSDFDPTAWFLAMDGDEIAGTSLCKPERRPGVGWVNVLAVRRPWRRLGKALLLHSFRDLRSRGRERAALNVDGENLTGAVRLYEQAGMRVAHRDDSYRKDL